MGFAGTADKKLVVFVCLKFRRPLTERFTDRFTKLQLSASPGGIEIGKPFSSKVFHLVEEFLELLDAPRHLFNGDGFRTCT